VDKGTLSIRHRTKLEVIDIDDWDQLKAAVNWVIGDVEKAKDTRTVVFDSLSSLTDIVTKRIIQDEVARKPDHDPDLSTLQDWYRAMTRVQRLLEIFRNGPFHFIATAQSESRTDEQTGIQMIRPALPGKLGNEVAGYFDVVGYLVADYDQENGTPVRKLQVVPSGLTIAKDRIGIRSAIMQNPTMVEFFREVHIGKESKK
jgi:hypothetical protein